jgi:tetratricopeptide (TPR) repeat protein
MRIFFLLLITVCLASAQQLPEGAAEFVPEAPLDEDVTEGLESGVTEGQTRVPGLELPELPPASQEELTGEEMPTVDPRVQFLLDAGLQYTEEGEHEEAERAYLRALEQDPGNPDIRMRISTLYILMERYADALKLLKDLEEEFPENPMIQNNMSWVYATGGKVRNGKLSLRHARNAILIVPYAASMWNTLAEAYYVLGDYDKALRSSEHAIDLLQQQTDDQNQFDQFLAQRSKILRAKEAYDRLFGADEAD